MLGTARDENRDSLPVLVLQLVHQPDQLLHHRQPLCIPARVHEAQCLRAHKRMKTNKHTYTHLPACMAYVGWSNSQAIIIHLALQSTWRECNHPDAFMHGVRSTCNMLIAAFYTACTHERMPASPQGGSGLTCCSALLAVLPGTNSCANWCKGTGPLGATRTPECDFEFRFGAC